VVFQLVDVYQFPDVFFIVDSRQIQVFGVDVDRDVDGSLESLANPCENRPAWPRTWSTCSPVFRVVSVLPTIRTLGNR
jgi:hypothetical protein